MLAGTGLAIPTLILYAFVYNNAATITYTRHLKGISMKGLHHHLDTLSDWFWLTLSHMKNIDHFRESHKYFNL